MRRKYIGLIGSEQLGTSLGASSSDSSYDLRNSIGSLNIEDQGNSNLCWAYAANKTIETNVKKINNKTYDYSESYWDYVCSTSGYGYRRAIGEPGWATDVYKLASANGVPTEQAVSNASSLINAECITKVTQYIIFPYIDNTSSYTDKIKHRDTIKSHITKYGAVTARTNAPRSNNGYNASKYAFCSSISTCNSDAHIMNIIGWDDNFSKDNFSASGSNKPSSNGAWLVANSWGTTFGNGGYLWISYEDPFINNYMQGVISTSDLHPYTIGYKYNKYYPNNNAATLKHGRLIPDMRNGTFVIQYDRKSKGLEYIDSIVVLCTGSTTIGINYNNNSVNGQFETMSSKYSYYGDEKDWITYSFEPSTKRLRGNNFAIKLDYLGYNYQTDIYGLYSADQIGGSTYLYENNQWNTTNYNPQVIVYTHSYEVESISIAASPKTKYYVRRFIR